MATPCASSTRSSARRCTRPPRRFAGAPGTAGPARPWRPGPRPTPMRWRITSARRATTARSNGWCARERAVRAYAYMIAADRVEAALTLLDRQGGDPAERGWLCVQLARLLRYVDQRRALAYAEQALALSNESDDRALAAYMQHHLALLRCRAGQVRDGQALMAAAAEAREALSPDDQERLTARRAALGDTTPSSLVRGSLANWLAVTGRYAEAAAVATPLVATGTAARDG